MKGGDISNGSGRIAQMTGEDISNGSGRDSSDGRDGIAQMEELG